MGPRRLENGGLIAGQQDAALAWIKIQEDAGIDIVSGGEQFRKLFVHDLLEQIEGIDWQRMTTMGIRDNRYDTQAPTVTIAIRRMGPWMAMALSSALSVPTSSSSLLCRTL